MKGLPSSDSIRSFFHTYASESHLAGSEKDRHLAEWTRDMFVKFGITNTSIETYWPLLNYPKSRILSLLAPDNSTLFDASLEEDNAKDATPTFHGKEISNSAISKSARGVCILTPFSFFSLFASLPHDIVIRLLW
jgi:N-acetylated-alpha-linked acidic dipeptidase